MKLKRYVLLDNNRIYDIEKLDGYIMFNIFKAIENDDTENLCRQLVATSDDVTDFIRENDLVRYEDYNGVFLVEEVEEVGHNWVVLETKILPKNRIVAIFKLIGKDYICVWEKEKVNE